MSVDARELVDYYQSVTKLLPCSRVEKKEILNSLKAEIADYLLEYPETDSVDGIINQFGKPEDIAEQYITSAEPQKIGKSLNKNKKIVRIVLLATIVIAVIVFVIKLVDLNSKLDYRDGEFVETIIDYNSLPESLPIYGDVEF